jgi:phospholipid/cholesterol/gamma-HCH transport system substrate-binding protein
VPEFKETNKQIQELAKSTNALVPQFKDTMKELQQLAKSVRDVMPDFKDTAKEIQQLAKSLRDIMPDFKETNKDFQQLIKAANKVMPEVNRTLEDFQLLARNWSKLGERFDMLLQTNEKKITKAVDDLNKTLEGSSKFFSKENQDALSEILKNFQQSSRPLDNITKNLDLLLKDSRKTLDKFNSSAEKADRVFDNLEKVTKPMADRGEKILKNLDEASDQLNKAMAEFRLLTQAMTSGQGTLFRLLNDPTLYNRLNDAACQANKLFPRLDHILQDMETFADKLARHPELIGIGGAIRPSSGLKDLPPYPTIWKSSP